MKNKITYNNFSDGNNIVSGGDKVEIPTIPEEPQVNRIDLKSKILDGSATLTGVTATASGDNILLSSPYGSDGNITFIENYEDYNFTKMYIKGHRNTGNSTYYHFYLGYTGLVISNKGNTWYPATGEDFEYTLEIPEGEKIENPYLGYCVGDIIIEEFYLE